MLPDYEITKPTDKKFIIIEFILILLILQSAVFIFTGVENEEAIQFRILAHSNTVKDQQEKTEVQQKVMPLIQQVVDNSETNAELVDNLKKIEPLIIKEAKNIIPGKELTFERTNALIPPKKSGFFIQSQAHYDTYLLTIGSGRGDNWWCALFQNVCFPEEGENSEEKVTFFIWEWIKSLFE